MTTTDSDRWKAVSAESLRFFGAMSAAVSHEIRNKLAVINEKAGLVQDIAFAVKSGRAVDPDRLEMQAGKIIDQVRQANRVVGVLNRLAHSVDAPRTRIDLADVIGLVTELYGRKAAQGEITISAVVSANPVSVITSPFLLAALIGGCVDAAIPKVDDSAVLTINAEAVADGATIRLQNLAGIEDSDVELGGQDSGARAMLEMLGGRLVADGRRGELVLEIRNCVGPDGGRQL